MNKVDKIIEDYRKALEEKLEKINQLDRDKDDLVKKKNLMKLKMISFMIQEERLIMI
ncbi:MAG: hypothetical protein WCG08_16985 [Paludibacter sp.]